MVCHFSAQWPDNNQHTKTQRNMKAEPVMEKNSTIGQKTAKRRAAVSKKLNQPGSCGPNQTRVQKVGDEFT